MRIYKIIYCLLILFFISIITSYSQNKFTISGYIKDSVNGEELIGGTVYFEEIKTGCVSNHYGFYSITLPKGNYSLYFSYIGFLTKKVTVDLFQNESINIDLQPHTTNLDEVVISTEASDRNIKSAEMGLVKLDMKQIKTIPVLMGEQDILKTIQLLPGVNSTGEGSSGYTVRGGTSGQNLILLDEAPVYNASHLLGFFSVFNSDAIKNANLIKGAMPASYGGRVSSVLDIQMKEGNINKLSLSGGVGLISSRLTVEHPIVKGKGSFIISGRRTYADMFLKLSRDETLQNTSLYFYDLNIKGNYRINSKNRIFLSGYFGRDVFDFNDTFGFNWGNVTGTIRWNHLFSDKIFLNSTLIYSDYNYEFGVEVADRKVLTKSGINDINIKEDFTWFLNPNNTLKFGFQGWHHTFYPGEMEIEDDSTLNQVIIDTRYGIETGWFFLNEQKISDLISLNYGIRISSFHLIGPGNTYKFDEKGEILDSTYFYDKEIMNEHYGIEPRISLNLIINKTSSIKASYGKNYQYIHLLTKTTSTSPTDLWVPSSNIIKPQIVNQVSLGYFKNFKDNRIKSSVEIYYKDFQNQIDYKNGADLMLNQLLESQIVFGIGRAYGVELLIEKSVGKFTGWIGYTLSKSERKFDEINNSNWYPARYDRTNDISLVGLYQINKKWSASANWVYNTGDAVTFPSGKYKFEENTVNLFTERNGYRMPDYHRLDVSLTWKNKKTRKFESNWIFSVYNVYGRKNAFYVNFRENEKNPLYTEAVKLSLFSIVPSISYNFKF